MHNVIYFYWIWMLIHSVGYAQENGRAIQSIADILESHKLVVLGERHGLQNQHEFFIQLLENNRIQNQVNVIVVEFANAAYQPVLDRLTTSMDVQPDELKPVWKDVVTCVAGTWSAPIYHDFFMAVQRINQSLPKEKRYQVKAGDPPFDWKQSETQTESQFREYWLKILQSRDQHFAKVVMNSLQNGQKVIAIYGAAHAANNGVLATTVEETYPGSVFTTTPLYGAVGEHSNPSAALIQSIKFHMKDIEAPALIRTKDTWAGELDGMVVLGENLMMKPGQNEPQPLGQRNKVAELYDALIYFGEDETLNVSHEKIDSVYQTQITKRKNSLGLGGAIMFKK